MLGGAFPTASRLEQAVSEAQREQVQVCTEVDKQTPLNISGVSGCRSMCFCCGSLLHIASFKRCAALGKDAKMCGQI